VEEFSGDQPFVIIYIFQGFTSRVLGVLAYQAPELIHVMEQAAVDAETDEEVPEDESPIDKEIFSDALTTKTDVYAYAMVALEVCSTLGIIRNHGMLRFCVLKLPRDCASVRNNANHQYTCAVKLHVI